MQHRDSFWSVVLAGFIAVASALNASHAYAKSDDSKQDEIPAMTNESKSITVTKSSSKFNIRLPSNATTGYRWFLLDNQSRAYSTIRQHYVANQNGKPLVSLAMNLGPFK